MAPNMSLHSVIAVLVLSPDAADPRLFAKYYSAPHTSNNSTERRQPFASLKEQKTFESGLIEKTAKQSSDVILYDNKVVVFKTEGDVMLFVVGSAEENEILLYNVVLALRDSLSILFKNSTDKRTVVENYDLVSLAIDEIVDDGIILETDPVIVSTRVSRAPAQDAPNMKNIDLSEQGLLNAWEFGKRKLAEAARNNITDIGHRDKGMIFRYPLTSLAPSTNKTLTLIIALLLGDSAFDCKLRPIVRFKGHTTIRLVESCGMKQRFSSLDVKVIAHELSNSLVSLRVANIYDLSSRIFLFKLAKPGTREQLLIDSGFRCHLTSFARTTAAAPSAFVSKLRKYLKSRRITSISQIGTDRVIQIELSDGQYRVFLEFFAGGNIVLTDKDYIIVALFRNVSEGNEEVDVRLGIRYPIAAKLNYGGVPALTKQRVKDTLERHVKRAEALTEVTTKKTKKKAGEDLKKVLAIGFPEYPTQLLDHAFAQTSFDASTRPVQALEDIEILSQVLKAVEMADRVFRSLGREERPKGYIIAKMKESHEKGSNLVVEHEKDILTRETLLYDEFHPFKPSQFENKPDTSFLEFDSFNATIDEFFSSIESQKLESRLAEREENARKKLEMARQDHEKRLGALQQVQELHIRKAEAIEANAHRVEEAIAAINGLIGQGMDWMDIAKLIENEQSRQNVVAEIIRLPLRLYENSITLLLDEASFGEDGDDGGYETDEPNDSDEEEGKAAVKESSFDKRLIVDIDLAMSPWANARQYYEQKKSAAQKQQKTLQASSKALRGTEQKISADLKKGLKQEKDVLRPTRKQFWFEKFWYFISSDGYLVLGGKDAQQNELLYRKYLRRGDVYVHADLHGAASVVVKNAIATPDAPIPPSTLSQAGSLSVCTSTAWDSKAVMAAWWVNADQVSKTAPTGEYLNTGGFMIKGNKNFLPPAQLLLGFAVAFQISDDSKANHNKHRVLNPDAADQSSKSQEVNSQIEGHPSQEVVKKEKLPRQSEDAGNNVDEIKLDSSPTNDEQQADDNDHEVDVEEADEDDTNADSASEVESEGRTGATNPLQTAHSYNHVDEYGDEGSGPSGSADEQPEANTKEQPQALAEIEDPFSSSTTTATTTITSLAQSTTQNSSSVRAGSSSTPQQQRQPQPRGKNTKAAKRAAEKYAHQDDSERALALQLLGSTKAQEKKEAAAVDKAAREAKAAADKDRRKAQHDRAAAAERRRMERLATDGEGQAVDDEEQDREILEQERRELANLDALVGNPMPDDEIIAALPIVAPWSALAKYKYKVKLQPGSVKKGKAVREIVARWVEAGKMGPRVVDPTARDREKVWGREIECIRAWRVEEVIGCLSVGKVRIVQGGGIGGSSSGGRGGGSSGKAKAKGGGGRGGKGSKKK